MGANFKIGSIFTNIFSGKSWVNESVPAPSYFVAAGNPVSGNVPSHDDTRPEALNRFASDNIGFIVVGRSMSPKGIANSDAVACRPIEEGRRGKIPPHKFVVVKVDKEWYEKKRHTPMFDYKLRYTLGYTPAGADFDSFYKGISQEEDSVLVERNKKELQCKFEEAMKYYGIEVPLILSLTFKEGMTHYSIHPAYLVEFEVVELGKLQSDGNWEKSGIPAA